MTATGVASYWSHSSANSRSTWSHQAPPMSGHRLRTAEATSGDRSGRPRMLMSALLPEMTQTGGDFTHASDDRVRLRRPERLRLRRPVGVGDDFDLCRLAARDVGQRVPE